MTNNFNIVFFVMFPPKTEALPVQIIPFLLCLFFFYCVMLRNITKQSSRTLSTARVTLTIIKKNSINYTTKSWFYPIKLKFMRKLIKGLIISCSVVISRQLRCPRSLTSRDVGRIFTAASFRWTYRRVAR